MTRPKMRFAAAPLVALIVSTFSLSAAALDFDALSMSVAADVRRYYEHLHQYPEIGKQETLTSAYIRKLLTGFGYTNFTTVPGLPTAVIATFDTGKPGRTIALRADMDARSQQESTNLPYASKIAGMMHSCGHDAHTAMLLGVAQLLPSIRNDLRGKIVFIFQPAEETAGGADDIVASGALGALGVDSIVAQHVAPNLPVGSIELSPGAIMAGSNYFKLELSGTESHAAAPHTGSDLPRCIGLIAGELPTVFARRVDQLAHPVLLSVTYIAAGEENSSNVLPASGTVKGTIRSFDDLDDAVNGTTLRAILEDYVNATAASCSAKATLTVKEAAPPTSNNVSLYATLLPPIRQAWGGPVGTQSRFMFAEDFAYYTSVVPSLYFSQGIMKAGLGTVAVHKREFTIHPDALTYGVKLLLIAAANGT